MEQRASKRNKLTWISGIVGNPEVLENEWTDQQMEALKSRLDSLLLMDMDNQEQDVEVKALYEAFQEDPAAWVRLHLQQPYLYNKPVRLEPFDQKCRGVHNCGFKNNNILQHDWESQLLWRTISGLQLGEYKQVEGNRRQYCAGQSGLVEATY